MAHDGTVRAIRARGGGRRGPRGDAAPSFEEFYEAPDGTRIAYQVWPSATESVFVVDVATGETMRVAVLAARPVWVDDHTLIVELGRTLH